MIDAKDLRIGNWVYPNEENATPYPVLSINFDDICCYKSPYDNQTDEFISYSELQPIPLTPDILEKLGFEKLGEHNIFQLANADIRIWGYPYTMQLYNYEDRWVDIIGTSIKYLHDLQNLTYALTKQELEYKP